jgi:hypothetical protein
MQANQRITHQAHPPSTIHPISPSAISPFFQNHQEINSTMAAATSPADFSAKKYFDINPLGTTHRRYPCRQNA